MRHAEVLVRPACADDVDGLVSLWAEMREQSGSTAHFTEALTVEGAHRALSEVDREGGACLFVAVTGERLVGMALARTSGGGAMNPISVVAVDYLHVHEQFARRGAGKALMTAISTFADQQGSDYVVVNVIPTARVAHRFFARLGFQPVTTRRMAPLPVLKRRLGMDPGSFGREGGAARRRAALIGRRPLASALRRTS